ncbi:hypothetical protein B14911_14182 [Bacillus sp. NRRL B-14911]|uniref:Uncharacterized protein n=1 Tax=Bacillus infantis NRRL B-14911 TaxID=1367477 RepID=U5LGK1_9BACI|nr:hypothetical protein N288_25820 [Bacillus infantis NRRL B-14911]EAR67919.1 hypothetical protein B14911_14182 [Bacillus sp. NRRL B-14911]
MLIKSEAVVISKTLKKAQKKNGIMLVPFFFPIYSAGKP